MPKNDGKVQCALCGRRLKQITVSHLTRFHPEMSLDKYKEIYGATTPKVLAATALPAEVLSPIATQLVEQIMGDENLVKDLTAKIGDGLFGQAMRGTTTKALLTILQTRLAALEKAAQNVNRVNSELFDDWRIQAGRDDGGPTPTRDLIDMAKVGQSELRDIAESILRLGQMAVLDGQRNIGPNFNIQVFSGEHEKVVMPDGLTPQRREEMRLLVDKFTRPKRDIEAVIAKARALRDADGATPVEVSVSDAATEQGDDSDSSSD